MNLNIFKVRFSKIKQPQIKKFLNDLFYDLVYFKGQIKMSKIIS